MRSSVSPYFWNRISILCELLEKRKVSFGIVKAKHQQDCTVGTFLWCTEFEEGPEKIATMNRVRMNHSCCQKNWDSSTHRSLAILFCWRFSISFSFNLDGKDKLSTEEIRILTHVHVLFFHYNSVPIS